MPGGQRRLPRRQPRYVVTRSLKRGTIPRMMSTYYGLSSRLAVAGRLDTTRANIDACESAKRAFYGAVAVAWSWLGGRVADCVNAVKRVVCGIDPGLGATGYAVIEVNGEVISVVDAGVCRFGRQLAMPQRLAAIEQDVSAILAEGRPGVVAVEALYAHYKHPRTAILMGHARGVVLLAAAKLGIEVRSYAATRIKRYLTGNGRATKLQMQRAVQTTLGLAKLPEPPDVADALAIAMCCWAELRVEANTEARA